MNIIAMTKTHCAAAAEILAEAFPWCYGGEKAMPQAREMLETDRIALVAVADGAVTGVVGAIPQYGVTGWELHPLAVRESRRGGGTGTALVLALEREIALRGGVVVYLGSDDEFGTTSLFEQDLFDDTFGKLAEIKSYGHPFPFYEKLGYRIVGVLPDANGYGKPDIWMAKRVKV